MLPEYCLSCPSPDSGRVWYDEDGKYLDRFQQIAKEYRINLVPGTIVESVLAEDGGTILLNTCYFIDRQGAILGKYVKKNLWLPEREYLTKGTEDHAVVDSPELGKIGLLVCWDIAFPEAFRALVRLGVTTFIIPAFWLLTDGGPICVRRNPRAEIVFLNHVLPARAIESAATVIFVNCGGNSQEYCGMSQVAMPFVGTVDKIDSGMEKLLIVEIDPTLTKDAEEVYKLRQDLASDDWHYGYTRP